jgi:hypothetical protein
LEELLWYLNNIRSDSQESIPQREELLEDLILEIIDRCPFRPHEGLPWTPYDFQFNLIILEELDLD